MALLPGGMAAVINLLNAEEGVMLEQQIEIEELDTSFSFQATNLIK